MQDPSSAPERRFAVRGDRRNGIDRLSLAGELDHDNVLLLEDELNAFAHTKCALIIDLRELTSIDRWGLHALERVATRAAQAPLPLAIVHAHGPVRRAFEAAGLGHLLSGNDVSEILDPSHGPWSPVSLPPLLGQRRMRERPGVAEERR